jgi:pimeloyl-ACP methyl ester carboxylesterase
MYTLSNGLRMPHYRTYSLMHKNLKVTRAVVVIHGNGRNADSYFNRMVEAAVMSEVVPHTLVVAPHFTIDIDSLTRDDHEAYWRGSNHWKRGNQSVRRNGKRISSFKVIDEILVSLTNRRRFPNLKKIVIAGHSAGGQFLQRYVAGHPDVKNGKAIPIRYVIANPGRYFYFNGYRPAPDFNGNFMLPKNIGDCDYNRYEYGMERRNRYLNQVSVKTLIDRYRRRDIILLLGLRDNNPNHRSLSTSCAAELQGRHRLERGLMFKAHIDRYFSPHQTRVVFVPRAGHSSRRMFQSEEGRGVIFD